MGDGTGAIGEQENLGDFETPEQGVPDVPRRDASGKIVPWETCLTLNNNWGFHANDHDWKSPELVIHTLVNCVSKGGNLLLNVGPDARGNIPWQSIGILERVGEWMRVNHASIYGCGPAEGLPKPDWGRFTQKGNRVYAHVMHPHIGHINLKGYHEQVVRARVLSTGAEAFIEHTWWGDLTTDNVFINVKKPTYQHFKLPDPLNTVYEIFLK
jgi:alpha-L-fucosidase